MNLENLGVQEMNTRELSNIEGGNWLSEAVGYAVGTVVGVVVGTTVVAAKMVLEAVVGD